MASPLAQHRSGRRLRVIPLGATAALCEIWRRRVVALFLSKGLLNPDFARKILCWEHSGFSIESATRILDQPTREALCQYIVRAPISLQRIRWDEQQDVVSWSSSPSSYFKGKQRRYSSLDFIAQVTLLIRPRGKHLVRRYGLCSSRGHGTWKDPPALRSRAPANWYGRKASADPATPDAPKDQEVGALPRSKAWARLLAKVYELDVLACSKCGSRMAVIAVILDPAEIRKIISCLAKRGRGPPTAGGSGWMINCPVGRRSQDPGFVGNPLAHPSAVAGTNTGK